MTVTPDQVRQIARLARLGDVDAEAMARELSGILDHVDALERELGGAGERPAPPSTSPATSPPGPGGLRGDSPGTDPLAEPPARFAPEFRDGFFTVPRLASHDGAG